MEKENNTLIYKPNEKVQERLNYVYGEVRDMLDIINKRYMYFNDRTLKELIDDAEYRVTGYVPTREEQGKEEWQSNIFKPKTRNKLKAILASVAQDVPDTKVVAQNEKQIRDQRRAYVMRHLLKCSYKSDEKELINLKEAWECAVKGTIITYEGYAKQKAKKKIYTKFEPETGEHEFKEEEVVVKDDCISFIIPLENFLIKDISIMDVQEQPAVAWVERMHPSKFEQEFSKYPNFKYVKSSGSTATNEEAKRQFSDDWIDRVATSKDRPIEVIRYYNKFEDEFIITANGVMLFDGPMVLGYNEKKYPFAKTIFELFAVDFFYGNPFPNTTMCLQDVDNKMLNMMLDMTYRRMNPPMIIGDKNKDDFDLDDESVSMDSKIYVQSVNEVDFLNVPGIDNGMAQMAQTIDQQFDESSVDANQGGVTGGGATAREVVIANENARKMKGLIFMFLTSLWTQKYKLRIENILTYYTQPKVKLVLGKNGKESKIDEYRKFLIENADLEDGSKGILGIQMVPDELDNEEDREAKLQEIDEEEEKQEKNTEENYEMLVISKNYLKGWEYDIKVQSDSLYQTESSLTRANQEDKLGMLQAFPTYWQANEEKLFRDTIISFGDDPDEYQTAQPVPPMTEAGMEGMTEEEQMPGEEMATAGQAGLPSPPEV